MTRLQSLILALAVALLPLVHASAQDSEDVVAEEAPTQEAPEAPVAEEGVDGDAEPAAEDALEAVLEDAEAATEAEGDAEEQAEADGEADEAVDAPVEAEVASELEAPMPPTEVEAKDTPNSAGDSLTLSWVPSENEDEADIVAYLVQRSEAADGPFEEIARLTKGAEGHRDSTLIDRGDTFYYKVVAISSDGRRAESGVVSATAIAQWFHRGRTFTVIIGLLLAFAILFNIYRARRGDSLFIRRIAGLESVEEAIGRSTEMGKPVLYIPGIRDMDDIQTIASMSILAHVAKLTAEYDTPILVPNIRAVVMSTAQEVVKQAYLDAGRPDAYQSDNIRYITDDQFGYAAAVDGIMLRDKPAANFFLGCFFAESLILAETGASTGAIQIAGTAMPSQLPFFVAACDYTLIGEELFAASAYLSREPQNLGSLKGQDWGKFAFMLSIVLGAIGATIAAVGGFETDVWWNISSWFRVAQ